MSRQARFPKGGSSARFTSRRAGTTTPQTHSSAKKWLALIAASVAVFMVVCLPLISTRRISADTGTGSISLTALDVAIPTENFSTLSNTAGSTTNTALPTGWYITEGGGGARDNEQYAVDTGGSTTGDIYSYGAAASTERAL